MTRRSGGSPRLLVNGISIPARAKGAPEGMPGTRWWEISAVTAKKLMDTLFPGKRPPRPGYEVTLPDSQRNGRPGYWFMSNRGGRYELMFYFR